MIFARINGSAGDGEMHMKIRKSKADLLSLRRGLISWECHRESMAEYYEILCYPHFDEYRFFDLMERFQLTGDGNSLLFPKGMAASGAHAPWNLCRDQISSLRRDLRRPGSADASSHEEHPGRNSSNDFSVVIVSHSLRELEDICDHIGLLHKGGILLSRDLEDAEIPHPQAPVRDPGPGEGKRTLEELNVVQYERKGLAPHGHRLGTRQRDSYSIEEKDPVFSGGTSADSGRNFINQRDGGCRI